MSDRNSRLIRIPNSIDDRLVARALADDLTINELVVTAIVGYLETPTRRDVPEKVLAAVGAGTKTAADPAPAPSPPSPRHCIHPRSSRKKLGYITICEDCGRPVR